MDFVVEMAMPPPALVAYTRTWSAYASYMRATGAALGSPEDPAVSFEAALLAALPAGERGVLRVVWPSVLLLATKRSDTIDA
jgi:hypothetical protein